MEESPRIITVAADKNSGQQADIELVEANQLWVAAGPGIEVADIWMQGVAGVADLRVRIMRLGMALEISVDRGEQSKKWWPQEAAPRLLVIFDSARSSASAKASVGVSEEANTVELGNVNF